MTTSYAYGVARVMGSPVTYSLISLNIARVMSTNFLNFAFNNCVIYNIKLSIIPALFFLSLSLKTFYISSPSIKGIITPFFILFIYVYLY